MKPSMTEEEEDDVLKRMSDGGVVNDPTAQPTSDWEDIKNFVGGAKPQPKNPLQDAIATHSKRNMPLSMDEGGQVPDDASTTKLTGLPTFPQIQLPPAAPVAPNASAIAQKPPEMAPPAPVAPPLAPTTPPALDPTAMGQAKTALGGIDPAALKAYLQKVNQPTTGEKVGLGLTGFADALMQGVSRAGPGHAEEGLLKNLQQNRENLSGIPGKVAEAGKEQLATAQQIQSSDPNSAESKAAQQSFKALLISAGAKPEEIPHISAKDIAEVAKGLTTMDEVRERLRQEGTYQAGMLGNARASREQQANEFNLQHPIARFVQSKMGGGSQPERVNVISPTGQIGHIPQSQLKDALAKGYKQQ